MKLDTASPSRAIAVTIGILDAISARKAIVSIIPI
jgi:hypothetical protein